MDKPTQYSNLIKSILGRYVEIDRSQPTPGVEHFLVTDDEHGHYVWMNLGWSPTGRRVQTASVYVRLKEGKFWIEEDWTEAGIATELLNAGVPHEDIVLAFHEPAMRSYTEFAAA